MEEFDEALMCGQCRYAGEKCKRVDGKRIRFYHPWFAPHSAQQHFICRDYATADWCMYIKTHYPGYEKYAENPDVQREIRNRKSVGFFVGNDEDTIYHVLADDFVNGTMWDGGVFKAYEKQYYVRTRSGFGYRLVTEQLPNGVKIDVNGKVVEHDED